MDTSMIQNSQKLKTSSGRNQYFNNWHGKKDAEIWKCFKDGSESAFVFIYEQYYDNLVNYGFNFLSHQEVVKDLVQDVFIELREKRKTIGNTDAIKPFLFTIIRRKLIKIQKKRETKNLLSLTYSHEEFTFEFSCEQKLIERQIQDDQILRLKQAIKKLSCKEREIVYHFYFENLTYAQIAKIMGYREVKTARTILYRALARLRKTLEHDTFYLLFLV